MPTLVADFPLCQILIGLPAAFAVLAIKTIASSFDNPNDMVEQVRWFDNQNITG